MNDRVFNDLQEWAVWVREALEYLRPQCCTIRALHLEKHLHSFLGGSIYSFKRVLNICNALESIEF